MKTADEILFEREEAAKEQGVCLKHGTVSAFGLCSLCDEERTHKRISDLEADVKELTNQVTELAQQCVRLAKHLL